MHARVTLSLVLLLLPVRLAAQGRMHLQSGAAMTCEEARDILLHPGGPEERHVTWASVQILHCIPAARSVLPRALRAAPPGTLRDSVVREAAYRFADTSLFSMVTAMARNRRETLDRRRWAVVMLAHFYWPSGRIMRLELEDGTITVGRFPSESAIYGTYPDEPAERALMVETIRWVGRNDPDMRLRTLARNIEEELVR